jgi:hypothetical protein
MGCRADGAEQAFAATVKAGMTGPVQGCLHVAGQLAGPPRAPKVQDDA